MSNWISKIAETEKDRINDNIDRLKNLRVRVKHIGELVVASNSGGFRKIKDILDEPIVKGRKNIWNQINKAFLGEYKQKIALDSPMKVQKILFDAIKIIDQEINKEKRELSEINKD